MFFQHVFGCKNNKDNQILHFMRVPGASATKVLLLFRLVNIHVAGNDFSSTAAYLDIVTVDELIDECGSLVHFIRLTGTA